jgi:undecaprenyl-diphosphatase
MSLIHVLILGLIEGVTEFLPISSTAHLIFVSAYLSVNWLINYLKKNSLTSFGIYRVLLSLVLFFVK